MRRYYLGFAGLLVLGLVCTAAAKDQPKRTPAAPANAQAQGNGRLHFNVDRLMQDYDRNGDGYLQRDEVPPYIREHFDELDTDHDGKLSKEELQNGAQFLQPRRRPSDLVYILIETSQDDKEAQGELQQMYDVLRQFDKNHDGKIDPDELKAARQHLLEQRVDNIMRELDSNHDGKISREEARGPIKRDFDHIDTNRDGFIDRDELMRAASQPPRMRRER